jgi:hypothetical protein
MSHLTSEQRNALPDSKFALPGERKYPVNNASHAANAKARATQQFNKGNLSASEKAQIDRRANAVLEGGAAKVAQAMMGKKR